MTAHYARWMGAAYRAPLELAPNEVPADLLARLGPLPGRHLRRVG